jgi:hypothetical protein
MSRAWASSHSLLAGVRYEYKVGRALQVLFPPPAVLHPQYPCGRGFVDFLIVRNDLPNILVECKASLTAESFAQIARYAQQIPRPCIRAIVCQRGGGCNLSSGVELLPALSALALSTLTAVPTYVVPWTGRFGVT